MPPINLLNKIKMKKLLLSALAVCAFTFSNAQETETTESEGCC